MTDLITRENSSFSALIQRFETFVVFDKFSFYLRGVLFSRFVHYDNQNKEKLFSNLVETINLSLTILFPTSFMNIFNAYHYHLTSFTNLVQTINLSLTILFNKLR